MTNNIVTVNVSVTQAPTPSNLQKSGCFVTQGGTTGAAGTQTLLTQLSDLTAILTPAKAITTLAWASGTVTATVAAHGLGSSGTFYVTISGAVPAAYNGTFLATLTNGTHFTYPLASDPGAETTPGTYQLASAVQLLQKATTFFAQGAGQAVYVNELGFGNPAAGVTALNTWIGNNPSVYYSYLLDREWASESTYLTFLAQFEALTSKTFFFTTMTNSNYTAFTSAMNCVVGMIEAPAVAAANSALAGATVAGTEFSLAAAFWVSLNYTPSSTSRVTPYAFSFLYGVTAYPLSGNGALFTAWKAAGVNWVGSGSEGGLTNTILYWGTTMDGRSFNYWYSVDWAQINIDIDVSNAIINGSNNPQNPLYLNQDGINRLQAVAARTLSNGISYGLIFGKLQQTALTPSAFTAAYAAGQFSGSAVVNADPFTDYYRTNPSNYRLGVYGGFSVVYTPLLGFTQVIFNINVTDFVVQ